MNKQSRKYYDGSCYIGIVGGEQENGECRDSIQHIGLRPGDSNLSFIRATKGYEARQMHIDRWLNETQHPFILLLDHDMMFQPDTLERLRSHRLPLVSGFYLRRGFAPIVPVWYRLGRPNEMPMEPFTAIPELGKLHPIGASGWGCILMHREVAVTMSAILKGEPLVIEDDMDVWPYDLKRVIKSISDLDRAASALEGDPSLARVITSALCDNISILQLEIRPLRAAKDAVGSDIRFGFYARVAGYTMFGDPDIAPSHMLNYPLDYNDYAQQPEPVRTKTITSVHGSYLKEVKRVQVAQAEVHE